MDPVTALMLLPGLIVGLSIHEFSHAWTANLLGDGLARRHGRVSLNPLRHLSALGTVAIFLLPFGWAKPVPINLYNFKHPKRDYLITSLAGPIANFLVVAACLGLMQFTRHSYLFGSAGESPMEMAHVLAELVVFINVILGVINLIPIPPLDGSKIWPCILPRVKPSFGRKTFWPFLIVLMLLIWTDSLDPLIRVSLGSVSRLTPTSDAEIAYERYEAGSDALEAGEYTRAEILFTEALAVNSWDAASYYSRAVTRGYLQKWHEALDDVSRSIELYGADPEAYEFRADILEHFGRQDDADMDRAMAKELRKTLGTTTGPPERMPDPQQ